VDRRVEPQDLLDDDLGAHAALAEQALRLGCAASCMTDAASSAAVVLKPVAADRRVVRPAGLETALGSTIVCGGSD
jgi:hypothetical protein